MVALLEPVRVLLDSEVAENIIKVGNVLDCCLFVLETSRKNWTFVSSKVVIVLSKYKLLFILNKQNFYWWVYVYKRLFIREKKGGMIHSIDEFRMFPSLHRSTLQKNVVYSFIFVRKT